MPVHTEHQEYVAVITLDDAAKKNAMTAELGEAFATAVKEVAHSQARVCVIRGAGGAFSGGGDLTMLEWLGTLETTDSEVFMHEFYNRFLCVVDLPMPTIAAIEGAAVGAGLCMALACDLRVVAESSKLGLNFAQLGIHAGMGATYLAPLRVGAENAADLLLTGRRFDGKEAYRMGMTTRLVKDGEAEAAALGLAQQIASAAPTAVRSMKRTIAVDKAALQRALTREAAAQALSYKTADFREGVRAAKERRAAKF